MIDFTVNTLRWKNEIDIAKRVAIIISFVNVFENDAPVPFCFQNKWQLDIGNNWSMEKLSNNLYQLRYRYTTPEIQVALDGLKLYLEWIFR